MKVSAKTIPPPPQEPSRAGPMRTGRGGRRGGGGGGGGGEGGRGSRAPPSPLKTLAGGTLDQPKSPRSGQTLDRQVLEALTQGPPPHQGAAPLEEERRDQTPSPYRRGEIDIAEAIAEIEGMDSEDWTYQLQDTPLKRLMEPDPQLQTGEWLLHNEELQSTEDQFHRRTREPEVERLQETSRSWAEIRQRTEPSHG